MFVKLVLVACAVAVASAAWTGPLAGGEPAARYPAGISPQACPNFPNCDNPAVAVQPNTPVQGYSAAPAQTPSWNAAPAQNPSWNAAPQYNPAPQYQPQWNSAPQYNAAPQWNGNSYNQNALDSGEYTGDGDYRGEGLAESGAFGAGQNVASPYASAPAPAPSYNPGYSHQAPAAQVPAGVDPSFCPNYPFCN